MFPAVKRYRIKTGFRNKFNDFTSVTVVAVGSIPAFVVTVVAVRSVAAFVVAVVAVGCVAAFVVTVVRIGGVTAFIITVVRIRAVSAGVITVVTGTVIAGFAFATRGASSPVHKPRRMPVGLPVSVSRSSTTGYR